MNPAQSVKPVAATPAAAERASVATGPLPQPASPLLQPLPVSDYAQLRLRSLAGHGLRVLLVCVMVGLMLGYLRNDEYLKAVVYSVSIGLCSWLPIDLGRFALKPNPDSGWPTGWRGPVLCVAGCTLGFFAGEAIGDLAFGHGLYSGYRLGLRRLGIDIAVSAGIGALLSGYYYLRGKQAYHLAVNARRERDLTLARLAMLQSQLEPHMLFNTLANLRVLIGIDATRAQAMLDHLNAYLRATLGASRATWHPLAAEFERLGDYLALMAVRMGPRLQLALHLPAELRQLPVPPLLLQPLVENAIQHGLEPHVAGGRITVRAQQHGHQLQLRVHDSGAGLPAGRATGVVQAVAPARAEPGVHGVGTQLVAERLVALYGERARLSLTTADQHDPDGPGTLAEVWLPLAETTA